ncbi:MAG: hypothetical protein JSV96_11615 [Candidatus Aminicenantes bacterium]|nr:MAG: hypothetical protein JSV96_11615 [Candidatus Aminicenantes bacterium]
MKKKTLLLLFIANIILISMGWILAFYSYPRLPQRIPLWVNFFGQQVMMMKKSPLFFVYPIIQTLFCSGFWLVSRIGHYKPSREGQADLIYKKRMSFLSDLRKEFVYMVLIFFSLIFIHLQRGIIFLAYGKESGVDKVYFYTLFGIILILIPLYRLRAKLPFKK